METINLQTNDYYELSGFFVWRIYCDDCLAASNIFLEMIKR